LVRKVSMVNIISNIFIYTKWRICELKSFFAAALVYLCCDGIYFLMKQLCVINVRYVCYNFRSFSLYKTSVFFLLTPMC